MDALSVARAINDIADSGNAIRENLMGSTAEPVEQNSSELTTSTSGRGRLLEYASELGHRANNMSSVALERVSRFDIVQSMAHNISNIFGRNRIPVLPAKLSHFNVPHSLELKFLVDEMNSKIRYSGDITRFFCSIRNIVAQNLGPRGRYVLEFIWGGTNFSFCLDKNGSGTHKLMKYGTHGHSVKSSAQLLQPGARIAFNDNINTEWRGKLNCMKAEQLTIKVWREFTFFAFYFVAEARIPLHALAAGSPHQRLLLYDVDKTFPIQLEFDANMELHNQYSLHLIGAKVSVNQLHVKASEYDRFEMYFAIENIGSPQDGAKSQWNSLNRLSSCEVRSDLIDPVELNNSSMGTAMDGSRSSSGSSDKAMDSRKQGSNCEKSISEGTESVCPLLSDARQPGMAGTDLILDSYPYQRVDGYFDGCLAYQGTETSLAQSSLRACLRGIRKGSHIELGSAYFADLSELLSADTVLVSDAIIYSPNETNSVAVTSFRIAVTDLPPVRQIGRSSTRKKRTTVWAAAKVTSLRGPASRNRPDNCLISYTLLNFKEDIVLFSGSSSVQESCAIPLDKIISRLYRSRPSIFRKFCAEVSGRSKAHNLAKNLPVKDFQDSDFNEYIQGITLIVDVLCPIYSIRSGTTDFESTVEHPLRITGWTAIPLVVLLSGIAISQSGVTPNLLLDRKLWYPGSCSAYSPTSIAFEFSGFNVPQFGIFGDAEGSFANHVHHNLNAWVDTEDECLTKTIRGEYVNFLAVIHSYTTKIRHIKFDRGNPVALYQAILGINVIKHSPSYIYDPATLIRCSSGNDRDIALLLVSYGRYLKRQIFAVAAESNEVPTWVTVEILSNGELLWFFPRDGKLWVTRAHQNMEYSGIFSSFAGTRCKLSEVTRIRLVITGLNIYRAAAEITPEYFDDIFPLYSTTQITSSLLVRISRIGAAEGSRRTARQEIRTRSFMHTQFADDSYISVSGRLAHDEKSLVRLSSAIINDTLSMICDSTSIYPLPGAEDVLMQIIEASSDEQLARNMITTLLRARPIPPNDSACVFTEAAMNSDVLRLFTLVCSLQPAELLSRQIINLLKNVSPSGVGLAAKCFDEGLGFVLRVLIIVVCRTNKYSVRAVDKEDAYVAGARRLHESYAALECVDLGSNPSELYACWTDGCGIDEHSDMLSSLAELSNSEQAKEFHNPSASVSYDAELWKNSNDTHVHKTAEMKDEDIAQGARGMKLSSLIGQLDPADSKSSSSRDAVISEDLATILERTRRPIRRRPSNDLSRSLIVSNEDGNESDPEKESGANNPPPQISLKRPRPGINVKALAQHFSAR